MSCHITGILTTPPPATATASLASLTSRRLCKVERSSRRRRLSSLLLLFLVCGFVLGPSSLLTSSRAFAVDGTADVVSVLPVTTGMVSLTTAHTKYQAGYSVGINVTGSSTSFSFTWNGAKVGDVIGVSVTQVGQANSFGVGWSNQSNSNAGFLERSEDTAYYKCLSSYCSTGTVAQLKNDSTYYISAYVMGQSSIGSGIDAVNTNLGSIRGYANSINEFMKTVVNQQVNINDNITTVANKINGVWTWLQSIQNNNQANTDRTIEAINNLTNQIKNQSSNTVAGKQLEQYDTESKRDNSGKSQQSASANGKYEADSQSLIVALKQVANAPATNCRIAANTHGLPLDLDFCKDPPPSWLRPLVSIPLAIASLLLSITIVRSILSEIERFRAGL